MSAAAAGRFVDGQMSNRAKKDQWVRDAVAITDALTSDGGGRYLCPLCLEWFAALDDLSLEHAPPASVGGRHMAVTCRACNSTAGATVDAALRWAETVRDFGSRRMTKSMPATFEFAGIEQRVEATFGQDGLLIAGVPRQNRPQTAQVLTAAFDKVVADGSTNTTMKLSFATPDLRAASVGWLRAAYLVAFATLGYMYIFRQELEQVRQQIQDPQAAILDRYCMITKRGQNDRLITLARQPAEFESVIILSNDVALFLPSYASNGTYEWLADIQPWPPGEKVLSGLTAPWPARPTYGLDRWMLE
jgi:HNH endonuclease